MDRKREREGEDSEGDRREGVGKIMFQVELQEPFLNGT